jgi:hypothetical protein
MGQLNLTELKEKFKPRKGFGATGYALDSITAYLNERIPDENVYIKVPYYDFNVKGKVSVVHRDVHGVMPYTYLCGNRAECVDENNTTTLFYGNAKAGKGNYIPFLSDCDVYFIESCAYDDSGVLQIGLVKGPNWRMYL